MNRRRFVSAVGATALTSLLEAQGLAQNSNSGPDRVWPRPGITPIPAPFGRLRQPVIDLAGEWKFTLTPSAHPWDLAESTASWTSIQVPGECVAQGFQIARDSEYPFRRAVGIPDEFEGHRILLRFDGVYSYARLWVNGIYIRDHEGGFTSWEADITRVAKPGQTVEITVGVTDRGDDISYGSHYAKHSIGGILRDVKLIAVPLSHFTRLHVATVFNASYTDASLELTMAATVPDGQSAAVRLELRDPHGRAVELTEPSVEMSSGQPETVTRIPVQSPEKWDAEHPHLYTLRATLAVGGTEVEQLERRFGFRKVEVSGNRLLVNGRSVKLRGVCRHSIHPLTGRSIAAELEDRDAKLLRDANVNFVRTSHYPPTEKFLDACDRYGIYVEEETAVCFQMKETGTTSDPKYESRFLNQFAEMIERDRSHPSVILWSLGNESRWGRNIAREYAYARQEDPSRPAIFSYPETVPVATAGYDIFSLHYPAFDGDLRCARTPKLNDECTHVSCYNLDTLRSDPGVRNFWGESLKRFWENCFKSDGCLGGAIWAGIDEVFLLPDGPVGYGYWGIIDGWRREKPEYWLTRKAYSPVRVAAMAVPNPGSGNSLSIPVSNWFDHTDFSELAVEWSVGGETGTIGGLHLRPHSDGALSVPARRWKNGEVVNLKFYRHGRLLTDEHNVTIGKAVRTFQKAKGPAPRLTENANTITVSGADFSVVFSKATGLISRGTFRGVTLLEGGPYLNLGQKSVPQWWLDRLGKKTTEREVVISLSGQCDRGADTVAEVEFEVRVDATGLITTVYRIVNEPSHPREVGVAYLLTSAVDRLAWERLPLWSEYPAAHIGRAKGSAARTAAHSPLRYRSAPSWNWSEDTEDFFLFGRKDSGGRGTNDFRSTKENVVYASCITPEGLRVRAEAAGPLAVKPEIQEDGKVLLLLNHLWSYPDLAWGNYESSVHVGMSYTNEVAIRLTDSDESEVRFEG